jgi:hypothetical protein
MAATGVDRRLAGNKKCLIGPIRGHAICNTPADRPPQPNACAAVATRPRHANPARTRTRAVAKDIAKKGTVAKRAVRKARADERHGVARHGSGGAEAKRAVAKRACFISAPVDDVAGLTGNDGVLSNFTGLGNAYGWII